MTNVLGFSDLLALPDDAHVLDLLDECSGLVGIYDENENLRYANAAFKKAYFITHGEQLNWTTLMRRNYAAQRGTVIQTDDIDAWISSVRSRRGKAAQRSYESDLHDGRWIWVVETMRPDGWIVYFGTDVTSLRQSERNLRHARDCALRESQTDDLTGISNRKHIMKQLENLLHDATRTGRCAGFACLMDLDHFKAINDTWGHGAGDQILTAFARVVRRSVRLRDGFGRIGGEEFLLLLPDTTAHDCHQIISAIFAAVRDKPLTSDYPELLATFSAGLCPIDPADSVKSIYAKTDKALYRAKSDGRNRLVIHETTP